MAGLHRRWVRSSVAIAPPQAGRDQVTDSARRRKRLSVERARRLDAAHRAGQEDLVGGEQVVPVDRPLLAPRCPRRGRPRSPRRGRVPGRIRPSARGVDRTPAETAKTLARPASSTSSPRSNSSGTARAGLLAESRRSAHLCAPRPPGQGKRAQLGATVPAGEEVGRVDTLPRWSTGALARGRVDDEPHPSQPQSVRPARRTRSSASVPARRRRTEPPGWRRGGRGGRRARPARRRGPAGSRTGRGPGRERGGSSSQGYFALAGACGHADTADRQLRLLHLQPLPVAGGGERQGAGRRPQRRGELGGAAGAGVRQRRPLARAGPARAGARLRRLRRGDPPLRGAAAGRLPRSPGAGLGPRRPGGAGAGADARPGARGRARRLAALRRHPAALRGDSLPLALPRAPAAERAGGDRLGRRRRRRWRSPTAPAPSGASSSTRSRSPPNTAAACSPTSATSRDRGDDGQSGAHRRRCSTRSVPFSPSMAESPSAFWLDSSSPANGGRFSFMGDATGPLAATITYDVDAREVTVERGGETEVLRRVDLRLPGARARTACAHSPPTCPSTSTAASPATSATSSRPSAAARAPTPRRSPTPPSSSPTACSPSTTSRATPISSASAIARREASEAWLAATEPASRP